MAAPKSALIPPKNPGAEEEARGWKKGGYLSGHSQDAATHGGANGNGKGESHSEDTEKAAVRIFRNCHRISFW